MKSKNTLLLLTLILSVWNQLLGQNKASIFDELAYQKVLSVDIETDLDALTANIRDESKHKGSLSFEGENGETQVWPVKLQLRGRFRRMHCASIPPLKLDFDKDDLKAAGLAKYDDYKLVNYCLEEKEAAKELLIKEYLVYKMYNELSPASFRVQLLRVNYRDTKSNRKVKQLAILIEDNALLRKRLEASKIEKPEMYEAAMFDMEQVQTMALFQYMIGNTDWDINMEKNLKLIEKEDRFLAIPYDFDFSGVVNPSYGAINSKYNLTSLKDRIYLGFPIQYPEMGKVLALFKDKKTAIFNLVNNNRQLKSTTKKEILDYLTSFYQELDAGFTLENVTKVKFSD